MKPQNRPVTKSADQDVQEADLQSAGVGLMPEKIHEDDRVKTQKAEEEAKGQGTEVLPGESASATSTISGNSV